MGARLRRELAIHDWLVVGYLTLLAGAALAAEPHPLRARAVSETMVLAIAVTSGLCATRAGLVKPARLAALLYRGSVLGSVVLSYFVMRDLLPVVSHRAFDHELYALDLALFGGEPAMWMERFVGSGTTEWFSFFYLSYFPLLACYSVPLAFCSDRTRLVAEFGTGIVLTYCIGQIGYLLVPGWGPYREFAASFAGVLPRGRWADLLMQTVAAGSAQKDIFPSLHTAGALLMTLFAFRHRGERPFRYVWHGTAFIALNIVIATMFLRWHYVIDVVCGALLAAVAFAASIHLPPWERARRHARGAGPLWPRLSSG